MLIHVHNNLVISEMQERFTKCFPNLKIEFYSKPHHFKELTPEIYLIGPNQKIGDIKVGFEQGELEIKSWYKAIHVEKAFKDGFGLNAQIFRNANGKWIQTSETDNYTIFELNDMSRPSPPLGVPTFGEATDGYDAQ
jgi:hypothetical protein